MPFPPAPGQAQLVWTRRPRSGEAPACGRSSLHAGHGRFACGAANTSAHTPYPLTKVGKNHPLAAQFHRCGRPCLRLYRRMALIQPSFPLGPKGVPGADDPVWQPGLVRAVLIARGAKCKVSLRPGALNTESRGSLEPASLQRPISFIPPSGSCQAWLPIHRAGSPLLRAGSPSSDCVPDWLEQMNIHVRA